MEINIDDNQDIMNLSDEDFHELSIMVGTEKELRW